MPFGQVSFDPQLPFTILSYYFVAAHGYVEPLNALSFIAGFPTYEVGKYIEVKFKFIDGTLNKTKNGRPVKTRWSSIHPDLPKEIIHGSLKSQLASSQQRDQELLDMYPSFDYPKTLCDARARVELHSIVSRSLALVIVKPYLSL